VPTPRFIPTLPSDKRHLPLLAALLLAFAALVSVLYIVNDTAKVVGPSMEPALLDGDRILITKGYDTPVRGDIISFRAVIDGKPDTLIKRVVAIPGDTVEVFGDKVLVNGTESSFDSTVRIGSEQFHIGPLTVSADTVYVLGDNRPVSLDSRFIGPIALRDIRGRVTWVFSPVTRFRRIDSKG
jgi:signal peptidase I